MKAILKMAVRLKLTIVICLIQFCVSCDNSNENEKPDKNEIIANDLANKYKAVTDWDTAASFTYHFQKVFIEQNKLMLFKGKIYDIVKTDSNYLVKVLDERENANHNFLAVITFTFQQLDSFYTGKKSATGVFIIKVSKVSTSNPSIKEDERRDGEDHEITYSHLSDDHDQMITIFAGSIIDCHLEESDTSN